MSAANSRRHFLGATAAGGALLSLGDLSFLAKLRPVSADEAKLDPRVVRFQPEIEPLVRLIEDTPRRQLLEKVAGRIRQGTSYREILAALLLAGVRNVQPRPSVGFKFHAVLVVNSAHLASLSSPDSDRWLPIFWALDYFKSSQAQDVREGNWTMAPVKESEVPPPHKARQALVDALERWDEEAADAAVAGLTRSGGAHEVFEVLAHYGARDFRSIGHKAIFVANSWRTLQCIGWQYAEPVMRSLVYALLNHQGEPNPAESDLAPDRPWRQNQQRARQIRDQWLGGTLSSEATRELLDTLYAGSADDACQHVVQLLNHDVAPQSIYDAMFVGAGELLMRQPGIVALHAVTSTNALHYAFQTTASDRTRRLLLLQNAAFLPLFRAAMTGRGKVRAKRIERLEPAELDQPEQQAVEAVFQDVSDNQDRAAQRMLGLLHQRGQARSLIDSARRLIFLKGTNSHDYKFSSAVLEDFYHISPDWRNRYLATSVYRLRGTGDRDNSLVKRTRSALQV